MMAVQCDVKACYLLLVNFHASLGDFRREITGRSLSLRCRAGGALDVEYHLGGSQSFWRTSTDRGSFLAGSFP